MRTVLTCAVGLWLSGCAADPAWERRVASIEATLARAADAGAMRCAPRELALGRAHLGFAKFERERGQRARADEHAAIAEPNAGAALYLSAAEQCAERAAPTDEPAPREPEAVVDAGPVSDRVPSLEDGPSQPDAGLARDPETATGPSITQPSVATDPPVGASTTEGDDLDMDGVPNSTDECPRVAGEAGAACPQSYEGLVVRAESILLQRPLLLDDAGQPLEATRPILRALVRALADRPGMRIELGVHTDSEGAELQNLAESQRRAERLRDLLVAEGAAPERIRARGYGEELPLESNSTPEGRAANRRVEIRRLEAGDGWL